MNKTQRELLSRLMSACGNIGGHLDYTAVNEHKLIDRQKAHGLVSSVIYGVFGDHPNNEYRKEDVEAAFKSLEKLEFLGEKIYPDKHGFLKEEERELYKKQLNNNKIEDLKLKNMSKKKEMNTLQKKAVIEQLDPINSKVEKVGHLSVKLTYPCGCQFVEHYNETF